MKGIRVEPNATLIVDGGKVGSFCNSMWRGIEVWGDVSQHQYYDIGGGQYFQGRAIFKNNAPNKDPTNAKKTKLIIIIQKPTLTVSSPHPPNQAAVIKPNPTLPGINSQAKLHEAQSIVRVL